MLDAPTPVRSAKFPFGLLEQQAETEDVILTLVARIEQCRGLRDDESAIVERIGKARDMRARWHERKTRGGIRKQRRWAESLNDELRSCQSIEDRQAFAKRHGLTMARIRVQMHRLRLKCNAADVTRDEG